MYNEPQRMLQPHTYAYYLAALIMCLTNQNDCISEPPINFWLVAKFTWCYNFGSKMLTGPNTWKDFVEELEHSKPTFQIRRLLYLYVYCYCCCQFIWFLWTIFLIQVQIISTLNVLDIILWNCVKLCCWQTDFQYTLCTILVPNFTCPAPVGQQSSPSDRKIQKILATASMLLCII